MHDGGRQAGRLVCLLACLSIACLLAGALCFLRQQGEGPSLESELNIHSSVFYGTRYYSMVDTPYLCQLPAPTMEAHNFRVLRVWVWQHGQWGTPAVDV